MRAAMLIHSLMAAQDDRMDLAHFPGSHIITVSRQAFAVPDVAFLCFGESDLDSPEVARSALAAAVAAGHTRYPDIRGIEPLRHGLAAYLSALHRQPVAETRIQVTASGMAAIGVALAAVLRPGDRLVLHTPAWPNIANAARLRGAIVAELPLERRPDGGFELDLDRLAALLPGARAFVLNSPNNPTGWTATEEMLAAILDLCRRYGAWLIADEVYSRTVYGGSAAAPSLLDLAAPDERVIVCNSFSKAWAMTGWRIGWLTVPAGCRDAISELVEVTHSGVAPFIQHAAVAALGDEGFVSRLREHCARGRTLVREALADLEGVRYAPPPGAFYAFIGIDGLTDSLDFALRLVHAHRVAVAPGIAFGHAGEGYLRLCFAQSPDRLARAMDRLRAGLRERADAL